MPDQKCEEEYIRRIHKVQDYIEHHLDRTLSIDELAEVAGFSKFHFSRIFQGILHEPLAHYVNRIRMEQSLFMLAHRLDQNMTDIAYAFGYTDSAIFSRAFKHYYGVSPTAYRKAYCEQYKDCFLLSDYKRAREEKKSEEDPFPVKGEIRVEHMEEKQAAYVRHTGTYEALEKKYAHMTETLFQYARAKHLLVEGKNWVLTVYHDNPEFAEESQFRSSICLTVPEGILIQEDGVIGRMKLEGGLYAVGHFYIQQKQYSDAWNYMYQEWVASSGYVPRNSYPFEVYLNDPRIDVNHMHEVEIYIPIEPIHF